MKRLLAVLLMLGSFSAAAAPRHDKQFWKSIIDHGFAVPEGEKASDLVVELTSYFGSTDPDLRDEYAYTIIAQWVYAKRLFTPDELRGFIALWAPNLRQHLADHDLPSVLRRSFSALALSTIAALDNAQPFLEEREYQDLLDRTIEYLHAEHDLRGFDQSAGWIHATAHTADLLKFLARSKRMPPAQQQRVFAAVVERLDSADVAFTHGEETRLARTVMSLFDRDDLRSPDAVDWIAHIEVPKYEAEERVLICRGNLQRFLFSLYTLVATDPHLGDKQLGQDLRAAIAAKVGQLN